MQQALANQRNTMSPDQIRIRERELQDRVTNAQRQFRERNTDHPGGGAGVAQPDRGGC